MPPSGGAGETPPPGVTEAIPRGQSCHEEPASHSVTVTMRHLAPVTGGRFHFLSLRCPAPYPRNTETRMTG
jgi:hypothetical protein